MRKPRTNTKPEQKVDQFFRSVEHAIIVVIVAVMVLAGGVPAAAALLPRLTSGRTTPEQTASVAKKPSPSQDQRAASKTDTIPRTQYAAYDQTTPSASSNAPAAPPMTIDPQEKAVLPQQTLIDVQQQQQSLSMQAGQKGGSSFKAPTPISQSSGDAKALAVLHKSGLSATEISEAWWIHMHESISWTGLNPSSGAAGGWQIMLSSHPGVTRSEAFDPVWSTKWILHYMRGGRYRSVHEAYTHKLNYGWY